MADVLLNRIEYRDKVLACWLGKNIGGTLGAPFEWRRQLNNVSFYTQELGGQPLPNDDLDIQLIWLVALEERGIDLNPRTLADYWCQYVAPHWAEYGTGKINMRSGLLPPMSGSMFNAYKHSCGSYIRAEIWACIAPGLPQLAAEYAYNDAILDHGDGEGTFASVFIAALESAAFVNTDLRQLIDIGLSYIPEDCGVAQAVNTTLRTFEEGLSWREARNEVLRLHRGSSFFNSPAYTSEEDRKQGFDKGVQGYDVPSNIAITILGLLHGKGDFDKMICTTVNCGEDTDCTAATAGSIFGLMHGTHAIPQKWIDPIGRGIKTICLNLGDVWSLPKNVDELTDRTEHIAMQVLARGRGRRVAVKEGEKTKLAAATFESLKSGDRGAALYHPRGPLFKFDFFEVELDYGGAALIRSKEPKTVGLKIRNTHNMQANLTLRWYLPDGWAIAPARSGAVLSLPGFLGQPLELSYTFSAPQLQQSMNRAVLELTIEGRPTVMLVPVQLLNGDLIAGEDKKE